jgi:hypothetical protein
MSGQDKSKKKEAVLMFSDLFKEYPNKNMELRAIAKVAYEFGKTIAQEPSAGVSLGLDEHALGRQKQYIEILTLQIEAIHERPVPDMPYIHPTQFPIDLTEEYEQFTVDGKPINEDTQLLAQYWMAIATELAKSQSAGLAGSLTDADHTRATTMIGVITQYIEEMEERPVIDLPETAFPEAGLGKPSSTRKKGK